jgi:ribosomal-protein-alanine N-acetyltransferase
MPPLRPATPADAAVLAAAHAMSFDDPWSEPDLHTLLSGPGGFGVLARGGVGFAIARVAADEAELVSIGVSPALRGSGLGRALLEAAVDRAAALGAVQMHLEVAVDNAPALRLYETAGFAHVGRRRGYYQRADGRIDALVLTRVLNSAPV